jgi:glycosyltransferase involved in cell wall biosynthesis
MNRVMMSYQDGSPPSISVIIPAYNSTFIEETLASVYAQTAQPSQVIVINDGSTDDTDQRLRRLAADLPSSFIWLTKENGGEASARNVGRRIATGEYVAFLDHDDLWHPEKLERQIHHFASDSDLALSFTGYSYTYEGYRDTPGRANPTPEVIDHKDWDPDPERALMRLLAYLPMGPMSTLLIRRDALAELPPFDETLPIASDHRMYLELVGRGMKMDFLPEELVEYRWHGANRSRDMGVLWEHFCQVLDSFYDEHATALPQHVRRHARFWRSHWHLQTAIDARRHGDLARARRHIARAARAWPPAVRPGWVRMLGIGRPPEGPWP